MKYKDDNIKEKIIRTVIEGRKQAIDTYEKQPSWFTLELVFSWVRLLSKRMREAKDE